MRTANLFLVGHLGEGFRTVPAQMVVAPWLIEAKDEEEAVRVWANHNVLFGGEEVTVLKMPPSKVFKLGPRKGGKP